MIRFLSFLFNKPYEPCKSCQTLKEQLEFERAEKKELTQTLLNIINPKAIIAAPVELQPIHQTSGLWSRRREALEARDREEARLQKTSAHLAKPDALRTVEKTIITDRKIYDDVDKLEKELDIPVEKEGA